MKAFGARVEVLCPDIKSFDRRKKEKETVANYEQKNISLSNRDSKKHG